MDTTFSYAQNLPSAIGETLTQATSEFAAKRGLEAEAWYQGLPIWIVREPGARVNKVQVEAVMHDGRAILSFTPDAYQSTFESKGIVKKITRAVASPEKTIKGRQVLELRTLVDGSAESILGALEATFEEARHLPLEEDIRTSYKTPFSRR